MGQDANTGFKLDDITQKERETYGVSALATRPNAPSRYGEGGLTAKELKAKFDALAGILADRINNIHKYLRADDLDENISITIGGVSKTLAQFAEDLESGEAAAKYINVYNAAAKKSLQTVINGILQNFSDHVEANEEAFRSTSARIDGAVTTINIEPVVDRETIRIELTALNDKGKVLFSDSVSIANADYLIYEHNKSTDAHQDIRGLIQSNGMQIDSLREDIADVRVVAEGRVRARAYSTWDDALLAISSFGTLEEARKEFSIGDQLYIRTPKSTDAWVSGFETRHEPYLGGLGDDLDPFDKWESTEIHVGHVIISPLEAPDVDLTGYVTTDDFDEYGEKVDNDIADAKAHSVAAAKAYTAEEVAGVSDRVDILDKKVENLRAALSPEYFVTDAAVAYIKTVPADALPFAEVQEVGGMSYAEGGEIKNAAVTALEVQGRNMLDISAVNHTYPIPAEVQDLEGWGLGISADCHNRLDWGKKQYIQEVYKIRIDGSEAWRRSSATNIFQAEYKLTQTSGDTQKFPAIISNGYDFYYWMDPAKEKPFFRIGKNSNQLWIEEAVDAYANVDEWKAYLAANPVEIVYPLASPIVTDLPELSDDNFIEVEGGGTVTAVNEHKLAAPTKIEYQLKEATA